ncbi:ACT domain-containing protein [uncultured Hymenobacter sp.]|uniref:ACT domain-containing protein n=1 Tax=uncultured Hymenobacter sp. TaxID=170016 RepID=UPI0035CAADFF
MPAETNLDRLLQTMQPVLRPDEYVFVTLPPGAPAPVGTNPLGTFREAEGLTLIITAAEAAAAGLSGAYLCRLITLQVHSSLEAVGFLARISTRLAAHGLPVNAVAGYYHDHLFVPTGRAEEALALLEELLKES